MKQGKLLGAAALAAGAWLLFKGSAKAGAASRLQYAPVGIKVPRVDFIDLLTGIDVEISLRITNNSGQALFFQSFAGVAAISGQTFQFAFSAGQDNQIPPYGSAIVSGIVRVSAVQIINVIKEAITGSLPAVAVVNGSLRLGGGIVLPVQAEFPIFQS